MMLILIFALGAGFRTASAKEDELQKTCEQILGRILTSGRDFIPAIEFRVWEKGMRAGIAGLNSLNPLLFAQHDFDIFDEAEPTHIFSFPSTGKPHQKLTMYEDLDFEDGNSFAMRPLSEFENNSKLYFLKKPLFFFWPTTERTEFRYFNRLRPITVYPNALVSEIQDYDRFTVFKRPQGAAGIAPFGTYGSSIYDDVIGFFWTHDHSHSSGQASSDFTDLGYPDDRDHSLVDRAEIADKLTGILSQFEARVELVRRWTEDLSQDTIDRANIREGLFFYLTHEDQRPSMRITEILKGLRKLRSNKSWAFDMIMENPENIGLPNDREAVLDAIRAEEEFFSRAAGGK